jgi:hypothetical protein
MPRRDEGSDGDGLCDRCWWSLLSFFIIFPTKLEVKSFPYCLSFLVASAIGAIIIVLIHYTG